MIEQYTSPAAVNNSQELWLVGEGVVVASDAPIPSLDFNFVTGGLPGTVTFTRASTATYFNSAGVLTSAGNNVARFDYNPSTLAARGLLIEEQRTNSIRNNTMQGAVAGTPGTLPTNWSVVGGGLTANVIGTGIESGINYIDIQLVGTTSSSSAGIRFEPTNFVTASSGQSWTGSFYARIVSGSITNLNDVRVNIFGRTSANAANADNSSNVDFKGSLTASNLSQARRTHSLALADATTAFVNVQFLFGFSIGAAINITLRIGLPQLEQGAFATSVIPTTTTALTRNADVASVNTLSPWYNASEGTLYADFARTDGGTSDKWIANLYADANNRFEIVTGTQIRTRSVIAGVVASAGAVSAVTSGKFAAAYKASDYAGVLNGGSVGTNTGIASVITATALGLGNAGYTTSLLNGYLRRIAYYPRRLSNAELQAITA